MFERTNGGVQPTPAGRDFLEGARRVLDDVQTLVRASETVAPGGCGAAPDRLLHVYFDRRERARLCAGLGNGTIDIAIVTGEPSVDAGRSMALGLSGF